MNQIKLWVCVLSVVAGGALRAQEAEKFPLWPDGPAMSNGLKVQETTNEKGSVSGNSTAELFVYHPEEGKNTGKTVIIFPGGGYTHLAMNHEGHLFARWLTGQGITAVILKYRMPNRHHQIPLTDAKRAVRWVRSRAEEWDIDPARIGIAGFSAGGHLASTLATHFDAGNVKAADRLERLSCRPDFVILFYPVISMKDGLTHAGSKNALLGTKPSPEMVIKYSNETQVTAQTPPTFLIHSDDDKAVPPLNSIGFYQALKKHKVPAVLYVLPKGGHGWGLRESFEYYSLWTPLLAKWLSGLS